jgi:Protein of unknown function (DUF3551)
MTTTSFRSRLLLAGSALVTLIAISVSVPSVVHAQAWAGRGSWCVDPIDGPGFDCSFYSYQQCMATAWGLTNSCSPNPLYVPPRTQVRHKRQRPRR